MLLQNGNVELTKVHYFNVEEFGKNVQISIISHHDEYALPKYPPQNTVIKKNIFGHKWVLKINENKNLKKSKIKLFVYVLVFACILIALCFGIYLSVESKFFQKTSQTSEEKVSTMHNPINQRETLNFTILSSSDTREKITIKDDSTRNKTSSEVNYCSCNHKEEICIKMLETAFPKCEKIRDKKDPTGCGGLCKINKEYCKLLDGKELIFQCRAIRNKLNCSGDHFNCGNRCISSTFRCDGIIHCSDQSDEQNCECNSTTHFQCGNFTGCLERWKKCDGRVDCWDNSDELNCNYSSACDYDQVPCQNGECIEKRQFCDGFHQCEDKSDEPKGCELKY